MHRLSKVVAENENCKIEVFLKLDDKGKVGQNAGLLGRITNRYTEQLFEFFNANEIKVQEFARELKPEVAKPAVNKSKKKSKK